MFADSMVVIDINRMSQIDTENCRETSGWSELRDILKVISPFAALVWSATLCWTLTSDVWWTVPIALAVSVITGATLFCDPAKVRSTWTVLFRLAAAAIVIALAYLLVYVGVKITIAAVTWVVTFPWRHPYLFFGGVILLLFVGSGTAAKETPDCGSSTRRNSPANLQPDREEQGDCGHRQLRINQIPRTFVYLMKNTRNGYYKIGRSKKPGYREKTLQAEEPEIVLEWKLEARPEDEKHLHQMFAKKRIRGEWFELEIDDVRWIKSLSSRSDLYKR
jgi:hypothetical protein